MPTHKTTVLFSLTLSLSAGLVFRAMAADEKKDESPIGQVMKAHFKGDTSNIKKASNGELSKDEVTKLLAAFEDPAGYQAVPRPEAAWKEKTDALVLAGEKLEKGDADAGAAVKAAANCKSCHDVHRGKK